MQSLRRAQVISQANTSSPKRLSAGTFFVLIRVYNLNPEYALKRNPGKDIYCDRGAEIANELQCNQLIDEYIISFIPILLEDGIRLFKEG